MMFPCISAVKKYGQIKKLHCIRRMKLHILLGYFHAGDEKHVKQAIDAALEAKEAWANMSWENRANIFLKAADLIATKYRPYMNGTTMLGQSKNALPGRN